ncbi:MAG: NAD-dependent epimerase/dehydratase family protein [Candidatus Eisenbacteria bacterium]
MAGKALVTGVAGFIGSHLAEALLREGWEVVGIDAFTDAYDPAVKERNAAALLGREGFRLVRGDLNDADLGPLLRGADTVFHQAAQAGVRTSWGKDFDRYLSANIRATQRLLEACREVPLRRFVFASSSSVYGEARDLPLRESSPLRPHSPYGVTKLAAENLGHLYRANHGVPFTALRYFTVFGPRQRPDMAFHRLFRAAYGMGEITIFGTGEQTRDFTYVGDIVCANLLAARADRVTGVFNIGGGARVSLADVIGRIESIAGREVKRRSVGWEKGDVRDTWADCSAAERELRYRPETGLDEGLRRMDAWFRNGLREEDPS